MSTKNELNNDDGFLENIKKGIIQKTRQEQLDGIYVDEKGKMVTPFSFALEDAFLSSSYILTESREEAKKLGVDEVAYAMKKRSEAILPTYPVETNKFVGPNGIGKTEILLAKAFNEVKRLNLNPVLYDPYNINENLIPYPNSDDDCLLLHMSCVGKEEQDIYGTPFKSVLKVPIVENYVVSKDVDGNVNYKEVDGLNYAIDVAFEALKNFRRAIIILDEANRSPILDIFNAFSNGEPVKNVSLPLLGTMFFITQNSEADRNNKVRVSQDGAGNTKAATYHVYTTAKEWAKYAYKKDIHPTLISFVLNNASIFEKQEAIHNIGEIAHPTFRGVHKLSTRLYNKIDALKSIYGDDADLDKKELEIMFQSRVGVHKNSPNLPEKFAEYYLFTEKYILDLEDTIKGNGISEFFVGFKNNQLTENILSVNLSQSKDSAKYFSKDNDKIDNDNNELNSFFAKNGLETYSFKFTNDMLNSHSGVNVLDKSYAMLLINNHKSKELTEQESEDLKSYMSNVKNDLFDYKSYPSLVNLSKKLFEEDINKVVKNKGFPTDSALGNEIKKVFVKVLQMNSISSPKSDDFYRFILDFQNSIEINTNSNIFESVQKLFNIHKKSNNIDINSYFTKEALSFIYKNNNDLKKDNKNYYSFEELKVEKPDVFERMNKHYKLEEYEYNRYIRLLNMASNTLHTYQNTNQNEMSDSIKKRRYNIGGK